MEKKLLIQDMADAIATKGGITPKDALAFVTALFEVIEQALIDDKFIKIKGLGTFKIVNINERESVDVNTGERIFISGHARVSFTPDSQLKDLVNRPFAHFETVIINDDACLEEFDNVEEEPDPEDSEWDVEDHDDEDVTEAEDTERPLNPNYAIAETKVEAEATNVELSIPVYDTATLVSSDLEKATDNESETDVDLALQEKTTTTEVETEADTTDVAIDAPTHKNTWESEEKTVDKFNEPVATTNEAATAVMTDVAAEAKSHSTLQSEEHAVQEEEKTIVSPDKTQTDDPITSSTCSESDGRQRIEYILKEKKLPFYNIWKLVSVLLFALLLLLLAYFAGYFRWFCPCETTVYDNPYLKGMTAAQDCILPAADSVATQVDSLTKDTAVLIPSEDKNSLPAAVKKSVETSKTTKADSQFSVKPKTAENKKTENTGKTVTAPSQPTTTAVQTRTPEKAAKPAVPQQYNQVEGGKYEIVGTLRSYKVKRGESIRSIALKVYGSKGFAIYISTHNQLKDPNLISADTLLKLPELKKRNSK